MNDYSINTNFVDIVAGTSNKSAIAYTEASKNISSDNSKSMKYLKNFLTSIENLSSKDGVKDAAIAASKGNIKEYSGYENIQTAINFLRKNLGGIQILSNLISIHDSLVSYQSEYSDGYRNQCKLVMLEYECAVYMLISGLATAMCNHISFAQSGTKIVIKKKSGNTHGTIADVISSLAKELSNKNHKSYLESMNKAANDKPVDTSAEAPSNKTSKKELEKDLKEYSITIVDNNLDGLSIDVFKEKYDDDTLNHIFDIIESFCTDISADIDHYESTDIIHYDITGGKLITESVVYTEASVMSVLSIINSASDTVHKGITLAGNIVRSIKSSLFGIVPLIRTILFLRYKKKADKINALEEQIQYIKLNIEQLENKKGDMSDEKKAEIIKKQQAIIEEYNKKAEKLRAQLMEEEQEAATAVKSENPSMSNTDDEFVLEGKKLSDIFGDSAFSLQ